MEFNEADRKVYDTLEREYVLGFTGNDVSAKTAADLTNKLLQLSSGAIYRDNPKGWQEINKVKLNALKELIYTP